MHRTPLLCLACLSLALAGPAAAQTPPYKDPAQPLEARLADLLGRMTLEEKVAQLQGFRTTDPHAFDEKGNFVGGADAPALANGAGSVWAWTGTPDRFARNARERVVRMNSVQKYMAEKTRLGIPVFSFSEAVHGYMAAGATSFPAAIALGSTWDPALLERVFAAAAVEASARGVRQVLAPVLDLARDPRWGRFDECYGEDPYLVSRMGMAAIYGLQGRDIRIGPEHVAVTLKHFAGHGQPEGGRNIAPVELLGPRVPGEPPLSLRDGRPGGPRALAHGLLQRVGRRPEPREPQAADRHPADGVGL
jgi:beta-glucosidase